MERAAGGVGGGAGPERADTARAGGLGAWIPGHCPRGGAGPGSVLSALFELGNKLTLSCFLPEKRF